MGLHTVQFIGDMQVYHAFEKTDVVNWSFWQGKQMLYAFEGTEEGDSRAELEDWIKIMSKGTNAIYTLKFYKGWKGGDILPSTKESSSFNFRLYMEDQLNHNNMGTVGAAMGAGGEILQAIAGLRTDYAELKKKVDTPKDEDKLETWEKLLDQPLVQGVLCKILGVDMGMIQQLEKVAGVPDSSQGIDESVDILEKDDPKFEGRIAKLAKLKTANPNSYNMLLAMLDKM